VSWIILLPALLIPLLGCLTYFVLLPGGRVGQAAYTLTKVFLVAAPLVVLGWRAWLGLWPRGGNAASRVRWRTILWTGAVSGLVIMVAGACLMMTPVGEFIGSGAGAVTERAESLGFREHFVWFALYLVFIHSAVEEVYWRGFVYGQLRGLCRTGWAHLIAGLGFAAHHLVVTLQFFPVPLAVFLALCVAVGGVIWTVMYERQGSLVGCWISHALVDVLLMVVGYQLLTG
jgi:membrane protease YdiL (CAAX protease family)